MKRTITIVVVVGVIVLLILAGMRQIRNLQAEAPKSITQLQDEYGVPVRVVQVKRGTFTLSRTYLGTVEGILQGDAIPAIMEKVVEIPVKVGDRVKKGEVVCRLDTRASMARYNQLKLAYEDSELDARRMENLYAAGAISRQQLEKALLNRDIAKENLETSSEVVALTAPIDGVVTEVFYRPGETVTVGDPAVRIANLERVKIRFSVNFDDRKKLTKDTPVFIRYNANGHREIPAMITDIGISADPKSRLFSVWVEADNKGRMLQPGLLVDVRLVVMQKPDVVLIPRDAVLTRNEQIGVFVIQNEGRAVFTPIKLGAENPTEIEVISGLQSDQIVVVYGQNNLSDGQLVKIIES